MFIQATLDELSVLDKGNISRKNRFRINFYVELFLQFGLKVNIIGFILGVCRNDFENNFRRSVV